MIWYFAIGMNVLAVIIFFFLIFFYRRKWKGTKHYEKVRDELTLREEETEEEGYDATGSVEHSSGGLLGNLIGGFIVVLVGVNLISTVSNEVNQSMNVTTEWTSASSIIIGLIPLFFTLGIMSAGVALAVGGLRNAGLDIGEEEKPKKKTNKNKANGIKHYETIRDKVTKR